MLRSIFTYLIIALFSLGTKAQTPMQIMDSMLYNTERLKGFIAVINKTERFDDEYTIQLSLVKLNRAPNEVYIRQLSPKEGVEVLLNPSQSKKAVVNLNSFPWVNLYLDPEGSLMRRNQHHMVYDSGFDLMMSILKTELASKNPYQSLNRGPDTEWNGKKMYSLEFRNNDYKLVDYTVQGNEKVDDIAAKLNVNAYSILEFNDEVDGYSDVNPGQIIKVPSHYAKSIELLISQETYLPLVTKVFDDMGLYEKYEYNSITLNPAFQKDEFSEEFEHYNF